LSDPPTEGAPEDPLRNGPGKAVHPTAEPPSRITVPASETHVRTSILARIKDHKIAQWTLAYAAAAFALLHGATLLSDALEWPHIIVRTVTFVLIIGLPITPILAWYHGVRALKRVSGSELIIIALLLLIGGSLLWLVPRPTAERPASKTPSKITTAHVTPTTVPPAFTPLVHSIAVLPFTDMSEKKDQEYFADGMAEEIIDLLAKIPGLAVVGRTSSFQFKGKNEDLRTIGTQLNVGHVLEGSVRKSGDQVRITAQLIDTRTGTHDWSETYNRHIGDVLKLQDAIAAAVVRELQLTVGPGSLNSRSTLKDAEAYDLILRGRHAADRWDKEGFDEAATYFQRAFDRDPTSADAAVWLAWTYEAQGRNYFLAPAAGFEQSRRAAATALKLDPDSAEAHAVLADIHMTYDWDWVAAERELQQAMRLAPGNVDVLQMEAQLSLALGRADEALKQINAALAQDPLDPASFFILSAIQAYRGHLPEAEAAMRRVLDIRPTYSWGHYYLGLILLARGNRDAALLEMQQETIDDPQLGGLAMVYHALGRKADSDAALARMLKEHPDRSAFEIANVYAFRGQSDEAMHWLDRAYSQKDIGLFVVKEELPLKGFAADPRFKAFLRKMNLPE
jgi:TolB-like protein